MNNGNAMTPDPAAGPIIIPIHTAVGGNRFHISITGPLHPGAVLEEDGR